MTKHLMLSRPSVDLARAAEQRLSTLAEAARHELELAPNDDDGHTLEVGVVIVRARMMLREIITKIEGRRR
jgi:hypothetical protein